jgi:hypothetical protein
MVTSTQTVGDCKQNRCDGMGNIVAEELDSDVPDDGKECTDDVCEAGEPSHPPRAFETPCGESAVTYCNGEGECVGCEMDDDCPADTACVDWSCETGSSICVQSLAEAGTVCGATGSCTDGVETRADACDDQGACIPGATRSCAPFICGAVGADTLCITTCSTGSECVADHYCENEQCYAKKPQGAPCGSDANGDQQCQLGHCADGFCCNVACTGPCQGCADELTNASNGNCAPVIDNTDPHNACPYFCVGGVCE